MTTLEKSISLVQERALEQVEDSLSQWDDADASTIEQVFGCNQILDCLLAAKT